MFKKEKEQIEIIEGIINDAIDYGYLPLTLKDKIIGFILGFIVGFLAIQIFFGIWFVSLVVAVIAGIKAIEIYHNYLLTKRTKKLTMEFRDLLDSLSNSLSAGNNVTDSFTNALEDMKKQYGENAYITQEINTIVVGLYNNITIEELLDNFARRSHIEDIQDFSNTFCTCVRIGGNLKQIVQDCKDIISQKIDIELEIQTIIASSKNQLNIIIFMPFVIIGLMQMMGFSEIMELNITTITVKMIALIVFAFAYRLGQKMTKIEM